MIVFSGPTTSPVRPLNDGLSYYITGIGSSDSERSIPPEELAHQRKVNLSDLANITLDVLCRLQQLYNSDTNSQDQWIWELTDVNISDIVEILDLDGYIALSDVVIVPGWFKVFLTVLLVSCLIWSCVSNARTTIAIGIVRTSWTSTNVLIGALAVSDLLTVTCTTPTEISSLMHDLVIWDFGAFGCVTLPFLQSAAILSNSLILCLIAYDRYLCVVKLQPFAINIKANWKVLISVGIVWIASIVASMPAFWLWHVYYFILVDDVPDPELGIDFCSVFPVCTANAEVSPNQLSIYHIVLCGAIFIPLFILFAVLYCRIGHFLWVRSPVGMGDEAAQMKRKKRVAWALFWLIFIFFVCRMPLWVFTIVTMYTKPDHTVDSQILKSCLVFLSLLNTAMNPWLYSRLNESLKKTKENCTDKCCQMLSCFKCNCLLNTRVDHQPFSASDRQNNTAPQISGRQRRKIQTQDEAPVQTCDDKALSNNPSRDSWRK